MKFFADALFLLSSVFPVQDQDHPQACEEAPPTPGIMSVAFANEKANEPRLQRLFIGTAEDYAKEHLPSSAQLDLAWIRGEIHGVKGELLPAKQWVSRLSEQGVDSQFFVLIYANKITDATLAGWALTSAGFTQWYILDGGLPAWKKAKYETQAGGVPGLGKKGEFKLAEPKDFQVKLKEVIEASERRAAKLLDNRPAEQFATGYIPGAVNVPWPKLLQEDGTLKPVPELRKIFGEAGFQNDEETIVYCNSGHQASTSYFVLRYLLDRKKTRIYDGSIAEWKLDPGRKLLKP